jgi:hypothetical protein
MHRHLLRLLLVVILLAFPGPLRAQKGTIAPGRVPAELQPVARRAGTIFSGRVISVVPARSDSPGRVPTVTITFQVEQAVRGVKAGQTFSFREWTGLWSTGERYRVGQRLLLFLYTPSRLGLTSPVGGPSGRLPIDSHGQVVLAKGPPPATSGPPTPVRIAPGRFPIKDFARELRRLREE